MACFKHLILTIFLGNLTELIIVSIIGDRLSDTSQ